MTRPAPAGDDPRATTIRPGDLALVGARNHRRIVMVTDVQRRIFVGVLIHTCPELATDMDIAIAQAEVMPYPVVLQFDLYGTFYRSQVIRVLGRVPVDRYPITSLAMLDGVNVGYLAIHLERMGIKCHRGLPIWPNTERWNHKIEQLREDLQPLTNPFWSAFQ